MEIKTEHITFPKTGRYTTFGNAEKAKHLVIALHGYGQLATYFIRKFHILDPDKYFVVCPEAPHRFYLSGSSGRVGASWMTKEDRLTDIDDYVTFLDELYGSLTAHHYFEERSLIGFSQGGATASRWIAYGKCSFTQFLLWAAVFPPDMPATAKTKFNTQRNYFILGTKDEYTPMENGETYFKSLNDEAMTFEFVKFDGSHALDDDVLKTLLK